MRTLRTLPGILAAALALVALGANAVPADACETAGDAACCGEAAPAATEASPGDAASGSKAPCAGGLCPDGCAHCHLPCCAGLVFLAAPSGAPPLPLSPPRRSRPPSAPSAAEFLAPFDLDRPPRA